MNEQFPESNFLENTPSLIETESDLGDQKQEAIPIRESVTNNTQDRIDTLRKEIQKSTNESLIRKGVDFLFEQHPNLAEVGTQEQYSKYLETIFPESQTKDIVYHGTRNKFDEFSKDHLGSNTGSPSAFNGFFFASSPETSISYIGDQVIEYDPGFYAWRDEFSTQREENLKKLETLAHQREDIREKNEGFLKKIINKVKGIDLDTAYEEKRTEMEKIQEENKELWLKNHMRDKTITGYAKFIGKDVSELFDTYMKPDEGTYLLSALLNIKNPGIHDDQSKGYRAETFNNRTLQDKTEGKDGSIIENTVDFSVLTIRPALGHGKAIKKETNVYVVYEPDQIHVLGSEWDMEDFKKFISNQEN